MIQMTSLPVAPPVSPLDAVADAHAAGDARDPLALHHASPRRIAQVASDFESMFVSLMLKEMRQTLEPGTMFGQDTSDAYGGLFDMYMGQHIAKAGGFGIAELVKQNLNRPPRAAAPAASRDQAFVYQEVA